MTGQHTRWLHFARIPFNTDGSLGSALDFLLAPLPRQNPPQPLSSAAKVGPRIQRSPATSRYPRIRFGPAQMSQRVHINPQPAAYRPTPIQSYQPDPIGSRSSGPSAAGMGGIGMTGNPQVDGVIARARAVSSKVEDVIEHYSQVGARGRTVGENKC